MKKVIREEDINHLPKWASNYIRNLKSKMEADETYFNNKVKELSNVKETNIFINNIFGKEIPLPKDSTIIFKVAEGKLYEQFMVSIVDDKIEIRSGKCIKVIPSCSNVIRVERERR